MEKKQVTDRQWITGRQLHDMFLGPSYDSIEIIEMLREFAKTHTDAVAGYFNPKRTVVYKIGSGAVSDIVSDVALTLNSRDPVRLNRKYLDEFKETFELTTVQERVQIPYRTLTRKIKSNEDLRDLVLGFEKLFRGATGPDKLTGEPTVQKRYFPLFQQYVERQDDFNSTLELAKNVFVAHDINERVINPSKNTTSRIEKKMVNFAIQNPDAVIIRRSGLIGLRKEYLDEFLKFAGMKSWQMSEQPVQQLEIDPAAPGYPVDPNLEPLSDEKMDAVAWRLAGKKVKTAAVADDMIFAELARKSRNGKL